MVPQHAIVDHDENHGDPVLHGCPQFLSEYLKTSISIEADHTSFRRCQFYADSRWHRVSHGTVAGSNLRAVALVLKKTMRPHRVVPGTIGNDGVFRQHLTQMRDDFAKID